MSVVLASVKTAADVKMSGVEKDYEDVENRGGGSSLDSGDTFAELGKMQQMVSTSVSSAVREAAEGVRKDIEAVGSKVTDIQH
eukprot:9371228-Pyramimonas_sp.AAC.1